MRRLADPDPLVACRRRRSGIVECALATIGSVSILAAALSTPAASAASESAAAGPAASTSAAFDSAAYGSLASPRQSNLDPRLRIIATSDFHGAVDPRPDSLGRMLGGIGALATTIAAAEHECAESCVSVIVDAGDMFQGTAISNLSFGRPVVEMFDSIGYAAAALGNHEFDWGQDTLRALMRAGRFAFLGANVRYADGEDVDWIPNDTIVVRGEYRIGIIGISNRQTPVTTRAINVAELAFHDPVPIIDSISVALRSRGADAVIVIAHAGGACGQSGECRGDILEMAYRLTQPIDAIVGGHTHSRLSMRLNGIPIAVPGSRGQIVAVMDVPLRGSAWPPSQRLIDVYADSIEPPLAIASILERARSRVSALVSRPIATIAEDLPAGGRTRQFPLGNLVADAMRVVGRGDIAIVNTGSIRQGLTGGEATYGALLEVQPFGNSLYRVRIRGRDLRDYFARVIGRAPSFHVSGVRIVYRPGAPAILDTVLVGGGPLEESVVYTVVIPSFILTGGDNLGFGGVTLTAEPANLVDLEAFMAYLRSLPQPVRAPAETRLATAR